MNVLLLKAWLREQGPALIGGRLRGVAQYDARSLGLSLACEAGPRELLLSVLEEFPLLALLDDAQRAQLGLRAADGARGGFAKALKFHLAGYQLDSIAQEGFDRSVVFSFSQVDMYGKPTRKDLRVELVGRASNAYLLSERGMVVSIFKPVREGQNRVRRVITGKPLPPAPPLNKYVAAAAGAEGLAAELAALDAAEEVGLQQLFTQRVAGGETRLWPALEPLLPVEYDIEALYQFIEQLQRGSYTAALFGIQTAGSANAVALAAWELARAGRAAPSAESKALRRNAARRLKLEEQLEIAAQADNLQQLGLELLAQADQLDADGAAGAALAQLQHLHPQWAELLNPERSARDNAQRLLRYAQRLAGAHTRLAEMLSAAEAPERAAAAPPPSPSRAAQSALGVLDKHGVKCLRFVSSDGLPILCGVSDKSNDELVRLLGSARHLWLHVRDYPGSHVLVLSGGTEVPARTLEEAAIIAAYHSKGRREARLDVSYTPLAQVRRPRGGKPGQVLLLSERVLTVPPQRFEQLKAQLRWRGGDSR